MTKSEALFQKLAQAKAVAKATEAAKAKAPAEKAKANPIQQVANPIIKNPPKVPFKKY